ncbi:MAG: undecaprenyl-diphosphate phosphatase [bacterium]
MDTPFQIILLAILQGIAEFLPISSSGHLVLGQAVMGLKTQGVTLEVALHVGTLLSTLVFYRKEIFAILKGIFTGCRDSYQLAMQIVVSALPAVFFYLLFKDRIESTFESPAIVGIALMFTGCILLALRWIPAQEKGLSLWRALFIGIAQAIAVLPGVSRSGMTISAARMSGVSAEKSAEFSFLASIPLIAGAALKKLLDSFSEAPVQGAGALSPLLLVTGICISAIVGYFALSLLVRILRGRYFWCFGIYCLIAGCCTILLTR